MLFDVTAGWFVRLALIAFAAWGIVDLIKCAHSVTHTSRHLENGVFKRRPLTVGEYLQDYLQDPKNRAFFTLIIAGWCILMFLAWYEPFMKIM